jgi:hypothetical protein
LVTALLQDIGRKWLIPFVTIYGLAQTVLPAAIAQPSIPLLKTIAIIRALGWYMLAPMLVYAWAAVWKVKPTKDRNLLLVINIFIGFWLVISSARAGGDMWDNPRYRTIFIIWMAVIAAWGWINAREKHDPWLGRILAMEGICLAFFIEFYVSRYTGWFRNLNFFFMVKLILVLCAAVLIGSFAWDWFQRKKQKNSK